MSAAKVMSWAGAVVYLWIPVLLLGGGGRTPDPVRVVASLLSVSLLTGVLRRSPLPALAMTLWGATAVVLLVPSQPSPMGPPTGYESRFLSYLAVDLVLGYIVATCGRRSAVGAVAVSAVVQVVVIGGFSHGADLVATVGIALLAMTASCMAGLLVRERRGHAVALRAQEVAEAVTAERLRIARELHDMVAHSVGIIAIQAGVGGRVIETQPEEARKALRAIEETSRETLSGLRRTLVALRQADPGAKAAERAPSPGLADVERLAAATTEAGIRVDVRHTGRPRDLPADIELSAYRIVQEALTNVIRHADAAYCRVTVDHGDEELFVEVVDDGRGAAGDGPAHGFGLVGMRERVGLLHGRFDAGPRPGGGFRVAARLPLPVTSGVGA